MRGRIPPSVLRRMWAGRSYGIAGFMTLGAVVGLALAAVSVLPLWGSGIVFIAICVASIWIAYTRGRVGLLPDAIVDEVSADAPYVCRYADAQALRQACELTKPYYGNEYVSPDVAELWRAKNDRAFVAIYNSDGDLCACFGVIALTPSFLEQFVGGRLADKELRYDDVLSFNDSLQSDALYLSGVVVAGPQTTRGLKRTVIMLWAIIRYLRNLYGTTERTLYALSVTKESERLLRKLRFKLASPARERKDACDLYSYALSAKALDKLELRIGDYNLMCNCDF